MAIAALSKGGCKLLLRKWVFLEKLTVTQLANKNCPFIGLKRCWWPWWWWWWWWWWRRRFITIFKTARQTSVLS